MIFHRYITYDIIVPITHFRMGFYLWCLSHWLTFLVCLLKVKKTQIRAQIRGRTDQGRNRSGDGSLIYINGNAYGFGDIKPWTKKEQDKAIKNSDKNFLNKLKKYLDHEEIDINKY